MLLSCFKVMNTDRNPKDKDLNYIISENKITFKEALNSSYQTEIL